MCRKRKREGGERQGREREGEGKERGRGGERDTKKKEVVGRDKGALSVATQREHSQASNQSCHGYHPIYPVHSENSLFLMTRDHSLNIIRCH